MLRHSAGSVTGVKISAMTLPMLRLTDNPDGTARNAKMPAISVSIEKCCS